MRKNRLTMSLLKSLTSKNVSIFVICLIFPHLNGSRFCQRNFTRKSTGGLFAQSFSTTTPSYFGKTRPLFHYADKGQWQQDSSVVARSTSSAFLTSSGASAIAQKASRRLNPIASASHGAGENHSTKEEMTKAYIRGSEIESSVALESEVFDDGDDSGPTMPWSDFQEWALGDNISKFTVLISPSITSGRAKKFVLWRLFLRNVPELAGYSIPFLQKMHARSLAKEAEMSQGKTVDDEIPGVLPMVDDFEFTPNGGISGRAYGLPGIADGTRINTPPLVGVEKTVPIGYVTSTETEDGGSPSFSYELGTCASSSSYSLDGTDRSPALLSARGLIMERSGKMFDKAAVSSAQIVDNAKDAAVTGSGLLSDQEANRDILYLGGATAMLLASATAVGMLSHHLTVNVFWV